MKPKYEIHGNTVIYTNGTYGAYLNNPESGEWIPFCYSANGNIDMDYKWASRNPQGAFEMAQKLFT